MGELAEMSPDPVDSRRQLYTLSQKAIRGLIRCLLMMLFDFQRSKVALSLRERS